MNWETRTGTNVLTCWKDSQLLLKRRNNVFNFAKSCEIQQMEPSTTVSIQSKHPGCTHTLAVDQVEFRYLLSGGKQGTVSIHDLEQQSSHTQSRLESMSPRSLSPLHTISISRESFQSISSVQWFPTDCGMFLTSDLGGRMVLFDTNSMQPALQFSFSGLPIHSSRLFSSGSIHSFIAVGLENGEICICDPRVGRQPINKIQGHSGPVHSLDWSLLHDFSILSGGEDGAVRLWDVRQAGGRSAIPLLSLDWTNDHTFTAPTRDVLHDKCALGLAPMVPSVVVDRGSVLSRAKSVVAHSAPVKQALFTPGGKHIITAGNDCRLRLWSAKDGLLLPQRYEVGFRSQMSCQMAFLPSSTSSSDDLLLLPLSGNSQSKAGDIGIVPLYGASGRPLRILRGHMHGPTTGLAVRNHRTAHLVSAAADGLILYWQRNMPRSDPVVEDYVQMDRFGEDVGDISAPQNRLRLRQQRGVESRYDFKRDVMKQFADQNSVHASSQPQRSATPFITANHEANVDRGQVMTHLRERVNIHDMEIAPRRFVPPIIRQYLQQARFRIPDEAEITDGRNTGPSTALPDTDEVDWMKVDKILAGSSDDENSDSDSDTQNGDVPAVISSVLSPGKRSFSEDPDIFGGVSESDDDDHMRGKVDSTSSSSTLNPSFSEIAMPSNTSRSCNNAQCASSSSVSLQHQNREQRVGMVATPVLPTSTSSEVTPAVPPSRIEEKDKKKRKLALILSQQQGVNRMKKLRQMSTL